MKYAQSLSRAFLVISSITFTACTNHAPGKRPKLVVGIVVDQMRWDYLYRFNSKYSHNGFKRLMREGFDCENTHINYFPSYTGPGHACVYTGSVPSIHGIAGNAWYDRDLNKRVNCVDDPTVTLVGLGTMDGHVSPRNLLSTTITDELRLATNFKSKVISIALKDRSSVIPGGHHPTGAYFVDGNTGNFITTSYYMKEVPTWVNDFNHKNLTRKYLDQDWNTLLPIEQYTESTKDNEPFERSYVGEPSPTFPHHLAKISRGHPDVISYTPFGNSLTLDFAKAAIAAEHLGASENTDFLAISLSSTDLVGHQFGPNSIEAEDCFLRVDRDLGSFFTYLDETVGKGNYVVMLTADHGVAHSTDYMGENGIPAGCYKIDSVVQQLNIYLGEKLGEGEWIHKPENMQFYLNRELMAEKKVTEEQLFGLVRPYLVNSKGIADVIDLKYIATTQVQNDIKLRVTNGYNQKRSGDFQIIYEPGWIENYTQGATHGTPYSYDTHIPLLWMGWKIKHGKDDAPVFMTDIAPTLAAMLHIQEPSGSIGRPIVSVLPK